MPSRRQLLAGVGGVGSVALAGCLGEAVETAPGTDGDSDWPMSRFDTENTAYNPDAKAPRKGVRERWTFSDGTASGTPAIVDGTVFLPTADALVALDSTSGKEKWRFEPEQGPWPTSPVVHDGLVCFTMIDEDSVVALDAKTGKKVWTLSDAGHVHSPLHLVAGEHVHDPHLYVGTQYGTLLRIDPKTGEILWQTNLFGDISAFAYKMPSLYVGTKGGEVYAFTDHGDADDPLREAWRSKVGSAVEAMVPTSGGIVVHTFADPLTCLQTGAHAGTMRWTVNKRAANSPPVYAEYTLFSAGYDRLSAIRDHDKDIRWQVRKEFDSTGPVAAGDTLYVSGGTAVHAFALDGGSGVGSFRFDAKRWSHPTPAGAVEGLSVADGALFAACEGTEKDDTTLYCLESA